MPLVSMLRSGFTGTSTPTPTAIPGSGDIFQPPAGGVGIPGTPLGAGPCPPGTRCVGPSVDTALGSICLGTCSPYGTGGDTYTPGCPSGTIPVIGPDGSVRCVESGLPEGGTGILEPVEPETGYVEPVMQGGGACGYSSCGPRQAIVPTIHAQTGQKVCPRGFKLNKTTYFLKDGTCVPAYSRCVKIRHVNPANSRAGRRAGVRLKRHHKALKSTEDAIRKGLGTSTRRRK